MSDKKKNKQKKEKVVYYDDNSTIADMSNIPQRKRSSSAPRSNSTFREKFRTYINAVKMMIIPMCVVIIFLCVVFFVLLYL